MRKLFIRLAMGAVAVLVVGTSAHAGPLLGATFSLQLSTLTPAVFTAATTAGSLSGSGAVVSAPWTLGPGAVPSGAFSTTLQVPGQPLTKITITVAGNTAAAAFNHTTGGQMLVGGTAIVKGLGATLVKVPLKIGVPNSQTLSGGGLAITAIGNAWTTKTAVIDWRSTSTMYKWLLYNQSTSSGTFQKPTKMAVSKLGGPYFSSTRMGVGSGTSGLVVMVSAVNVITNIADQLPTFATLTLDFVHTPEPGTLLLLGSGIAGLLAVGGRRMRR